MSEGESARSAAPPGCVRRSAASTPCAGEVEARSNYYYSTWGEADEAPPAQHRPPRVVILGSGPNRIGQGIEFDYCCVHAVQTFRALGYEAVMVNCNPETVSTDYDTSDRLYFEPLDVEAVLAVCDREQPEGVVIQFGGQTPLKLARAIEEAGYTDPRHAVRRGRPRRGPRALRPPAQRARDRAARQWGMAADARRGRRDRGRIGYPVLVAPVVRARRPRDARLLRAGRACARRPAAIEGRVLVDRFLENAVEVDVDALCDGTTRTSAPSCSTSRRPACTPATPRACCRRRRSAGDAAAEITGVVRRLAAGARRRRPDERPARGRATARCSCSR